MTAKYRKTLTILLSALIFSLSALLHASSPVWTFTRLTPTTISVSTADRATIEYQVTNQSRTTHVLEMRGITGISQNTTSGHCANPFTLGYQQSCRLTLTVDGSSLQGSVAGGPVVCQQGNALQCYQPSRSDALNITLTTVPSPTTLSTNVSHLALSKTGYTEYGLPGTPSSGVPRTITVSNTGDVAASNLSISYPIWPSGTTKSSDCPLSLEAGSSCTITIIPGDTATSDGTSACTTGVAPTPQTISISAVNASMVSTTVVILGYGCIYQGGYVYALDDTTLQSTSVGGKVASTFDQATPSSGIIWSSNDIGGTSQIGIYGISEISTTSTANPNANIISTTPETSVPPVLGQTACNGNTDGSCDTNNIYVYYQPPTTIPGIDLSLYATGLCKLPISGYSDWYLPAICEMGYGSYTCGGNGATGNSPPTLQNMQSNLVDTLNMLSGNYWSSTQASGNPQSGAWIQTFSNSQSDQYPSFKIYHYGVRCSRALTS